MSWVSEILSGGAGAKQKALQRTRQQAIADFRDLGGDYSAAFDQVMQQYTRERGANISLYRTEMGRAEASFSQYFDQARTEYGQGMDRALGEMRTGRESTLALSRQQTEQAQQRAISSNAFTGLSQSSFGQGRVENIGRQGTLQQGAIQEQYAQQLSGLEAQRAQGMSTLSAQQGQGLSGIQQMMASSVSNMYQTYSANIANMQTRGLGNQYNMYQHGLNLGYGFAGQSADLTGGGMAAFGSALGSVAGSLFGTGLSGTRSSPDLNYTTSSGIAGGGGYWPTSGAGLYGIGPH